MPKKHTPLYAQSKPSYVHPSLQSSRASTSSAPAEPQSVNQRIQQLRREQAPRATPEQRDEIASVVSRTVPPELRRILHIPEVNAPKPKAGTRTRRAVGGTRPPPGPPAPSSWLQSSRHAPAYMRAGKKGMGRNQSSPSFSTLARVTDDELKRLPSPRSLVHQCLRTFAEHWEELVEYEQHYLLALPVSLKEALLSYLTIYGRAACLDFKSFKILFQNEQGSGTAGWDETQFLDLTSLLSEHFTVGDLGRCLKRSTAATLDLNQLHISVAKSDNVEAGVSLQVADSWEEEAEEASTSPPILLAQLQIPHFTSLSRLSLARPGQYASWPDLLRVSTNLNKLTHLSLAYWPRPSMTPNANTTSMVSNHTSVSFGGSHFYSDLDDDWHEATNIVRRFSVNTYSLQWLDLEGCNWLKALSWQALFRSPVPQQSRGANGHDSEHWNIQTAIPGPDWNDSWRRITYMNFYQGWIPNDSQSLQNMPAGVLGVQLLSWLRENKDREDVKRKLNVNETGFAVGEWVAREKVSRLTGNEIQAIRRGGQGEWLKIDYGWGSSM